jgi:POT family proton-dependent oligopeptide transporter
MLQFFLLRTYLRYWLKPTAASKQKSKEKAAAENTCKCSSDRIIAVLIFSVFTVFFWASFEQAGGSMTIFAENLRKESCLAIVPRLKNC